VAGTPTTAAKPLPYEFDSSLINSSEAAELVGVAQSTIRNWAHRGTLTVADRQDGRPLFRPADVVEAEFVNRRADPAKKRQRKPS
jgi:phage terminase Nu1 subunit (DNA packaging protein)